MPNKDSSIWSKFYLKKFDGDNKTLNEVYHVAHIHHAISILNDNKIKSGLVYDKSKLNKERIAVNWLSPNHWHFGYHYGNVAFCFDFSKILRNKKIYWVEVINNYSPPACRFLITENEYSHLTRYNPRKDEGPLRHDIKESEYCWNGNICLELMVESDLPLTDCKKIEFVKHHSKLCCIDPSNCKDKDLDSQTASERLLAYVIANKINIEPTLFTDDTPGGIGPGTLSDGINKILTTAIRHKHYSGCRSLTPELSSAILSGILVHIGNGDKAEFKKALNIFEDYKHFEDVFLEIVKDKFEITDLSEFID